MTATIYDAGSVHVPRPLCLLCARRAVLALEPGDTLTLVAYALDPGEAVDCDECDVTLHNRNEENDRCPAIADTLIVVCQHGAPIDAACKLCDAWERAIADAIDALTRAREHCAREHMDDAIDAMIGTLERNA